MITKENYCRKQHDNPLLLTYPVTAIPGQGLSAITDRRKAGKTSIAIDLVAAVSIGQDRTLMPVGMSGAGTVLFCVVEDSTVSVMGKLRQKGANLDRVYLADCTDIQRLDTLIDCLEKQINLTHLDMIVIDDIDVMMVDSVRPTGYDRHCLYRLNALAQQAGCVIVIVCRSDET